MAVTMLMREAIQAGSPVLSKLRMKQNNSAHPKVEAWSSMFMSVRGTT